MSPLRKHCDFILYPIYSPQSLSFFIYSTTSLTSLTKSFMRQWCHSSIHPANFLNGFRKNVKIKPNIYNFMASSQNKSAGEDHFIWLKAPEQPLSGCGKIDFLKLKNILTSYQPTVSTCTSAEYVKNMRKYQVKGSFSFPVSLSL